MADEELLTTLQANYRNTTDANPDQVAEADALAQSLGSDPKLVEARVLKTLAQKPAHFKEAQRLNERDLLLVRGLGTEDRTRMAGRLVTMAIEDLSLRVDTRVEWAIWQALQGSLTINENGVYVDQYREDETEKTRDMVQRTNLALSKWLEASRAQVP